MSKALIELVKKQFGSSVLGSHSQFGDDTVVIEAKRWVEVHRFLRDNPAAQMTMLVDLCAVDYPDREPRFELVTHLMSIPKKHRLRVKTLVGDHAGEGAEVGTLVELWGAANWFERETWDMMGITFLGHPDLRRILTYPEFEGHPLRKDYPANRTQPLVPYREGPDVLDKLAPFGFDEGMPFGRQTHLTQRPSLAEDPYGTYRPRPGRVRA
ncbi:MAG: NADH-quinone oxidoreductase subunit C [Myxococcales bacterium]|nr:NADH-quinone oxidoreductase subunit C [Polyangiaceae bacterium]MDW8250709.1 NADH-quinone oxidoreductase subunit C [Myxococcales bacterium]